MFVKFSLIFLITCAVVIAVDDRVIFTRCELVSALRRQSYPELQMRTWVCIVEAESNRDTSKKTSVSDGTFRWGLFQLANPTWCVSGSAGGKCNVRCEDLLTNDITKSATCASTVYKELGFSAWTSYSRCQTNLPDITACSTSTQDLLKRWRKLLSITITA